MADRNSTPPSGAPTVPHPSPSVSPIIDQLNAAHLAMERLSGVISVSLTALQRQDEVDPGIAVCLENAIEMELSPARDRIRDALELLPEVSHG